MPEQQKRRADIDEGRVSYHVPVMLTEAVGALVTNPSGVYVDCTFGGGGHSRGILDCLNQEGRLIAFDQDDDARVNLPDDPRLTFIPHNFRYLSRFLRLHGWAQVDGILADLGVSSHQFDEPERGFSIRFDGPLDMRMDKSSGTTAADLLQKKSADELQFIFQEFGEVTNAKTLSRLLCEYCRHTPIKTIAELKAVVAPIVKGNPNRYFAQLFQALRMAVNDEVGALRDLLTQSAEVLKPGGRLVVITFHSIEDRLVKQYFKHGEAEHEVDPVFGTKETGPFNQQTRKPVEPSSEEILKNPRSRSARMRVGVRK